MHFNKYVVSQFTCIKLFSKGFVYIVHFVKVQFRFCCDRRVDRSFLPVVATLPVCLFLKLDCFVFFKTCQVASQFLSEVTYIAIEVSTGIKALLLDPCG